VVEFADLPNQKRSMRELLEESKYLIVEAPKKEKKRKGFLPADPPRIEQYRY
jgi:hypothetical protein